MVINVIIEPVHYTTTIPVIYKRLWWWLGVGGSIATWYGKARSPFAVRRSQMLHFKLYYFKLRRTVVQNGNAQVLK